MLIKEGVHTYAPSRSLPRPGSYDYPTAKQNLTERSSSTECKSQNQEPPLCKERIKHFKKSGWWLKTVGTIYRNSIQGQTLVFQALNLAHRIFLRLENVSRIYRKTLE
jgi:hypothetical protein